MCDGDERSGWNVVIDARLSLFRHERRVACGNKIRRFLAPLGSVCLWALGCALTTMMFMTTAHGQVLAQVEAEVPPVIPRCAPSEPIAAQELGIPTPIDDPSGRALGHFYKRLRETEQGRAKTRIVVYGASHMAGDAFTKILRHRLQDQFGNAGPGYVVPAKPWRDYNHKDVKLDFSKRGWESYFVSRTRSREDGIYGLAGVSFSSRSKKAWARVDTNPRSGTHTKITQAEIYYWSQRRGGAFDVYVDGKKKKRVRTRSRTPGPGYATFELKDASHSVEIRPRGNGPVLFFGMALDRDAPGVVMDTLGINGSRASSQLEWDPRLYAAHLTRRAPDLVVLAYGTNATGDEDDPIEAYERRLDHVVSRVKGLTPEASCLLIGPSDRPVKLPIEEDVEEDENANMCRFLPRPRQSEVIAAQRRVAHRYSCGYWDWAMAMGGELSMLRWVHSEPKLGAKDYIHHTRAGYTRLAEIFWDALMVGYEPLAP